MADIFDSAELPWHPVRPDLTRDVEGRTLLDGRVKVVLTRVAPGGSFTPHRDAYGHLFYVLSGQCTLELAGTAHPIGPGGVAHIPPGEEHGYRNCGAEELLLLSLNLTPS